MQAYTTKRTLGPLADWIVNSAALAAEAVRSRLFLITTISAMGGQVTLLAAAGALDSAVTLATVAFTVIGGAGSFVVALREAVLTTSRGRRIFAATALLSIGSNTAAALVGAWIGAGLALDHIHRFAGAALVLVAWEIALDRPARLPGGIPAALLLVLAGLGFEVVT